MTPASSFLLRVEAWLEIDALGSHVDGDANGSLLYNTLARLVDNTRSYAVLT